MSSLPLPTSIFTPDTEAALVAAVCDVAERSFFAYAERCDAGRFAELVEGTDRWYSAAIAFQEGDFDGSVRCLVPEDAAATMFDAFSGRGFDDPEPSLADVSDLIGELANMVCGAWLTRAASHQTFSLRTLPVVLSQACAPAGGESWITFAVYDRPFAVAVRVDSPRAADDSVGSAYRRADAGF
jgi:hypothetical protein